MLKKAWGFLKPAPKKTIAHKYIKAKTIIVIAKSKFVSLSGCLFFASGLFN